MAEKVIELTVVGTDLHSAQRELRRVLRDYCLQDLLATYKLQGTDLIRGFKFLVKLTDVSGLCEEEIWRQSTEDEL